MKKTLLGGLLAAMALGSAAAGAATYNVTNAGNYTMNMDFTASPCTTSVTCTNFTTSMGVSGSFTVPTLAVNLSNSNITSAVTSFSFSDGVTTYASTDPDVRAYRIDVSTDASGNVTGTQILLEKWLSGASPHAVNDRAAYLITSGTVGLAYFNDRCTAVGTSPGGTIDSCTSFTTDNNTSFAVSGTVAYATAAAPVAATPASVPTLSEWGMIILAGLMAAFGVCQARRGSAR